MLHKKIKDLKYRKKYLKKEKLHLLNTFLIKTALTTINSTNLNSNVRKRLLVKCLIKKRLCIKNRNVKRCVMTNRSRGVLQQFKISRSVLRELMGFGIIPGCKKTTW